MIALLAQGSAEAVLFYLFAAVAGVSALGVVLCRDIVRMAVCLLFTLAAAAGLYFLLSAEFLAAVQLVVYAGGTLVLIVFGIMLTNKSPLGRFEPARAEVVIALSVAAVVAVSLIMALTARFPAEGPAPEQHPTIAQLGQALLGDYLIPFELISVLLLVVMIGAAFLAKGRRRAEPGSPAGRSGANP